MLKFTAFDLYFDLFFQFELLYIEVLYTIKHKIGTTSGSHLPYIQDLYQYTQESFRVSPEDHARLLAKATEEKVNY